MAARQQLDLRQRQGLRLNPQLQQSIQLLQMTNLELSDFLDQALEGNPLLERRERENRTASIETEMPSGEPESDYAAQGVYGEEPAPGLSSSGGGGQGWEGRSLEERLGETPTLREHLEEQILLDLSDPGARLIAAELLGELDPAGYYAGDLAAAAGRLGCAPAEVEAVLTSLQRLDPPGVFARDLAECLALQLAELDRLDPAMKALVGNLDMLAKGELRRLRQRCRVDEEDFAEMLRELRALNPKPGLSFEEERAELVIPDILLRLDRGGDWILELNPETLPKLLIDRRYHARLKNSARSGEDKSYLSEQLAQANWLVRALDQRARTLLKVARAIVRRQNAFFRKGIAHLVPMTLREIAEDIEMHESTVSRAVAGKYIATPRGNFPLRQFFGAALSGGEGETHAAEAVRHRIKGLIDSEPPQKPLSDDQIVALLAKEGVTLARRTVAKYRDALGIPSSSRRKRQKAAAL